MRQHGIKAKPQRKFLVTTDSRHSLPVAPDLVQRRFNPEAPNQLWAGDITYIQTDEDWLYLAAVIDLFSRQVVGWSLQPHMQASLVKGALAKAWWRRRPSPGLIFHSDRGSQGGCNRSSQHWVAEQILGTSARCCTNNDGTRHSAKRPREPWVKDYTKQGQGQRGVPTGPIPLLADHSSEDMRTQLSDRVG